MNSPIVTRRGVQTRAMLKSKTAATPAAAAAKSAGASTTGKTATGSGNSGAAGEARKPSAALLEAKRRARLLKNQSNQGNSGTMQETVTDIFQNAVSAKEMLRKPTGVIYDERMVHHCCLWDEKHPECPERFSRVMERCQELKLIERCQVLPSRSASKAEIMQLHTEKHYERLQQTAGVRNDELMEEMSSHFDSIYIHPSTFELSLLATGCTIELVDQILQGKLQNGMAIIRPPGHHAMKTEFNGYCFFNNVALATQHALDKYNLQRILIIDYDVHHGQGTQRFFYNDPRVLYFSVHRFEHGTYWPNLPESDYDAIGAGPGLGYNFNVPLNATGQGNGDYLAIFQQILVPVALEFQPELIIVSAGYDAALGCPEGEMEVTPACYPHLLNPLLRLAESKVAVVLEGGYCLDSLAEGAALSLRALLGDPCPPLVESLEPPSPTIHEAILNCIYAHRPHWRCLQLQETYSLEELNNQRHSDQQQLHCVRRHFVGGPPLPERFPTRDTAPKIEPAVTAQKAERLRILRSETKLSVPTVRVCYAYDPEMLQHHNLHDDAHPEQPQRIRHIHKMHEDYRLLERMQLVAPRSATTDEICLAHTRAHLNFVRRLAGRETDDLQQLASNFNSVYLHPKTFDCATLAAGTVLQVVDAVLRGDARSGVCIVRPPGHHAEPEQPHGFCIFNNVAIAAQYAIRDYGLQRVLIVDWDVHHGNGTQHIFESNPKVLYVSVHRYENGTFFPKGPDGNYDAVGKQAGKGFNVNIPWNKKGMGDLEYALAFQNLIMPIAYEFDPQLVLVSAGFDAAIGDPLGGCKVTPEGYGLFTHWLSALAGGRIIVCLEGGYNLNSISYAMTMCTKSLLGDPVPTPQFSSLTPQRSPTVAYTSCLETLQNCLRVQRLYWKSLAFGQKLPQSRVVENNNEDFIADTLQKLNISNDDAQGAAGGPEPGPGPGASSSSQPENEGAGDGKPKTLQQFLAENKEALELEQMFAVYPIRNCPHLHMISSELPESIDTDEECSVCSAQAENWLCLSCKQVCCGRYINQHMEEHYRQHLHPLTMSFCDLSVWCYQCASYVEHPKLYAFQSLAHLRKFEVPMPWIYKQPRDEPDHTDDASQDPDLDQDQNEDKTVHDFYLELGERQN